MQIRIISESEIRELTTMKDAIDAMRDAFSQLAKQQATMPLRTTISVPEEDGISLYMPGYLQAEGQLGIKIASLFPKNPQNNIPAITASIVMLDTKTGAPLAIMEGGYLTALRTGAVSGLATDLLAKNDAAEVAIIGSGVQAGTQLAAVRAVRDIKKVKVYSRSLANAEKFAASILDVDDLIVEVCNSASQACLNTEVICLATGAKEPLIYLNDLNESCHINAVGSHTREMHEFDAAILGKAVIVADQRAACLAEAGEIIEAIEKGYIKANDIIELGTVVNRPQDYSEAKQLLTCFKSVGLAIQDISVAAKVLTLAEQNHIGTLVRIS